MALAPIKNQAPTSSGQPIFSIKTEPPKIFQNINNTISGGLSALGLPISKEVKPIFPITPTAPLKITPPLTSIFNFNDPRYNNLKEAINLPSLALGKFLVEPTWNFLSSGVELVTGKPLPKLNVKPLFDTPNHVFFNNTNLVDSSSYQQKYKEQIDAGVPEKDAYRNTFLSGLNDAIMLASPIKEGLKFSILKTNPAALIEPKITSVTKDTLTDYFSGRKTAEQLGIKPEVKTQITEKMKAMTTQEKAQFLQGFDLLDAKPSTLGKIFGISEDEAKQILNDTYGGQVRPSSTGALPGTRVRPGQAPAFGLSTQEVENVGYGGEKPKVPDIFTKSEIENLNRNSHFNVNWNEDYKNTISNIQGKLNLQIIPTELKGLWDSFIQKYTDLYKKGLEIRANNPSPVVTGRANFNNARQQKLYSNERAVSDKKDTLVSSLERKVNQYNREQEILRKSSLSETDKIKEKITRNETMIQGLNPERDLYFINKLKKENISLNNKIIKQATEARKAQLIKDGFVGTGLPEPKFPVSKEEQANKDWEENYAPRSLELDDRMAELRTELKNAGKIEQPPIQDKLDLLLKESTKLEQDFLKKWGNEPKTTPYAREQTKTNAEQAPLEKSPTEINKTESVKKTTPKLKQVEPNQPINVSSENNAPKGTESQASEFNTENIPTIKDIPPKLEETRIQLEIMKESLDNNQAQFLAKYEATSGIFKGELPEVTGKSIAELKASKFYGKIKNQNVLEFAQKGDKLVEGFDDAEKARLAYSDYKETLQKYKEYLKQYRADLKEYKNNQKDARFLHRFLEEQHKFTQNVIKENARHQAFVDKIYGKGFKAGVKAGYKEAKVAITNQLRNTLDEINRSNELDALKTKIKTRDFDRVKGEIVDYVKNNIPVSDRGVFLNMVKDAKTQQDLIRAFTRIDKKTEEIILDNAIKNLKDTADKLSEKSSVAVDYRNKIKDIIGEYELKGHQQSTIDKLKATQDFIDKAKAEGQDVELPQRIIDKLEILSRIPKDQLTLSQVEGLTNEIELLGKLGETKWATKQALYDGEKDMRKNILLQEATPINEMSGGKKVIGEKPGRWVEKYIKLRNYLKKTNVGLTPIDGLADITGMHPMKATLDLNFGNYLTYNDKTITDWYGLTKDFTEKEFERIGAVAISKQSGGIERLENSGITKEEVQAITLSPAEEKAYNFVRDSFEKEFPNVKKYVQDVYNKDVGQVDNYVSFLSDFESMSDLEMYDRFGQQAEDINNLKTKTVEQGFTKERAKTSKIKLELDINKIFRRHIDDVAYMLTNGRDIKMYSEIINSPEMRDKLGEIGTLAWKQWLDLMARKGGSEGAKRIAALDILRRNMGAGVLAFRLSSALVQFSTIADTAATIGVEYTTKGANAIATSKEWRNFIMDNFPEVKKAVGDDIAFREFGEGMLGKTARVGLKPLQVLDGIMRSTASAGAYQKLAFEKGIKIDLKNPNKALIQEATKLMRNSQGSSFFKDQPLAISTGYGLAGNKSINKTILTFQSFMLSRWDNLQRQIWRLGIKEKNYAKAGMSVFWMIIVAAALEEGIRRGSRKIINTITGDDTAEKPFLNNAALNVVQNVPIVGSLVSAMTYSSNPVPVLNTFDELLTGITSAYSGKAFSTKVKGAVTALGAGGSLSGIPGASQASQIIKKAIPTAETKKAQAQAPVKKIYDQAKQFVKAGKTDEAQQLIDNLSDNDYEIYKDILTAEKTKATTQGKIDIQPTYDKIVKLVKDGKKEEAQSVLDALTDDQYHYYELILKQNQKAQVYK